MRIFVVTVIAFLMVVSLQKGYTKPCTFCVPKIMNDQSVFQGTYFNILLDYQPRVKGHLLVIPHRHIMKAHELTSEEWEELSVLIPKIVRVFQEHLDTDQ